MSATSTDEAAVGSNQLAFASSQPSHSRISLVLTEYYNVGMAGSDPLQSSMDVICERDTIYHILNHIEIRFKKSEHELRVVNIEKNAQIGKFRDFQAEQREAREGRGSPQVLIEGRAVSSEKKKRNGQPDSLSRMDVKYVGTSSIILKAAPKL